MLLTSKLKQQRNEVMPERFCVGEGLSNVYQGVTVFKEMPAALISGGDLTDIGRASWMNCS
jgi:glucokinase